MKNKYSIFWFLFLILIFFIYSFIPIITYDTRYSQHVNNSVEESKWPGRVFLRDRNGEVITDKMYPGGYYKFVETTDCFNATRLPLSSGHPPLRGGTKKSSFIEGGGWAWAKSEGVVPTNNCEFINALITIEDKNFYNHWGVNVPSKLRALWDNMRGKRVSGGSTITEQYVKNKYFKNTRRSYLQKAREAVLALYFDATREKDHILNIYYHDAYFGNQIYGIGGAMEVYFEKEDVGELSEEEITILLSLIHNPWVKSLEETYFRDYFAIVKKRLGYSFERTYLGKLNQKENIDRFPFVTQRWLSWDMTPPVTSWHLFYWEQQTPPPASQVSPSSKGNKISPPSEREVAERSEVGGSLVWTRKFGVSIDSELQWFAREVLNQTLGRLKDKNVTNGAIFAMIPDTGEVLIYQGSKDFWAKDIDGQVDVIRARRQPGSTMKPFLYLQGLVEWAQPDDLIIDIESEYNSFQEGKVYISENYSLKEYGLVRYKKALWNSFNNASVRLARELWLQEVYDFYKQYGFSFSHGAEHYGYSLVLGNPDIPLESLVRSYAKLLPMTPSVTQWSPSLRGNSYLSPPSKREVAKRSEVGGSNLLEAEKFLLYDILSDPDNRDVSFWVNSILNTSIPQAVKTGTSSDFRDNLVVSYHPDLVVWVWVGNNDNSSMQWVTGISWAGYIWHHVIEKAIELWYIKNRVLQISDGIVENSYCLDVNCYRKENIFSREWKIYHSRISDEIYSSLDIFQKLSDFEENRLEELWVKVQ